MRDDPIHESVAEKKCPLCGRGLARTDGPDILVSYAYCSVHRPSAVALVAPQFVEKENRTNEKEPRRQVSAAANPT